MTSKEKMYKIELVFDPNYCAEFDFRKESTTFIDFFMLGYTVEQAKALSEQAEESKRHTNREIYLYDTHNRTRAD